MTPQVRRSKPESQVPRPVTCRVGGECNRLSQPPSLQAPRLTHCCRPLKLPFRTQRRRRCGRPVISLIGRSGASSAEGQPLLTDLVDDMAPTKMRRSEGRHQSVLYITLKAKHSKTETFQVAGWRPSTSSRPGGLIRAEDDEPIAVAALAIPDKDTQGSRRPAAPLRSPSPHRHHPRLLSDCHRPLHLPHSHPRASPRSVRSSRPTGRTGSDVPASCWSDRDKTRTASFGGGRRSRFGGQVPIKL